MTRYLIIKKDKVFKYRPSKICGRQPLKKFAWPIIKYFVPIVVSFLRNAELKKIGIPNKNFGGAFPSRLLKICYQCGRGVPFSQ